MILTCHFYSLILIFLLVRSSYHNFSDSRESFQTKRFQGNENCDMDSLYMYICIHRIGSYVFMQKKKLISWLVSPFSYTNTQYVLCRLLAIVFWNTVYTIHG